MDESKFGIIIKGDEFNSPGTPNLASTEKQYLADIRQVLGTIGSTKTGMALLDSLGWHFRNKGVMTQIEPFFINKVPATTKPWCQAGVKHPGSDAMVEFVNLFSKHLIGRSVGAIVRFSPQFYEFGGGCARKHKPPYSEFNTTMDLSLFHELVHAFRTVSGKIVLPGNPGRDLDKGLIFYDTIEEFYAILVSNIYSSELNRNLRSSHHGFRNLDDDLDTSFEFFQVGRKSFELIERFVTEHRGLSGRLSEIKTPFNPIRAFCLDGARARKLSYSPIAAGRDRGAFTPQGIGTGMATEILRDLAR